MKKDRRIISVGNFDGLHIAHRIIIDFIKEYAEKEKLTPMIFTFENHPREFFSGNLVPKLLLNDEKTELLESLGIEVFFRKFDTEFANLSAEDFILNELISKFNMNILVIGDDHKFGKGRLCGSECVEKLSAKYKFGFYQLDSVYVQGQRVSSSAIREHLLNGNIKMANQMIGHKYFIRGKVVEGNKLGRKIGFPTANINVDPQKLLPQNGVYACMAIVDGVKYPAMLNIGYKPTVSKQDVVSVEVHIIDFEGDLYSKNIEVRFYYKIRDEKKFENIEHLKQQLKKDEYRVKRMFTGHIKKI